MGSDETDPFIVFQNVRVLQSTPLALHCRIGDRNVWLSRMHVSGKLWNTGDHGTLSVRTWMARDRHLIALADGGISGGVGSLPQPPAALHLVRKLESRN